MTLKGLEKLLLTHGIDCEDRLAGVTQPDNETSGFLTSSLLGSHHYREVQIQDWIQEHHPAKFAVLDDYKLPDLSARQVRTERHLGLTDDDAARVIGLLS
jgi:hypothetical protein